MQHHRDTSGFEEKNLPKRLYKYSGFSARTLDMILRDHVYYADPTTFNDPLDSHPSLAIDVDQNQLPDILEGLIRRRKEAEHLRAAKTLRLSDYEVSEQAQDSSQSDAAEELELIYFNASMYGEDSQKMRDWLLRQGIKFELVNQFDFGVVSLSQKATCPLMWSHYGDQHRGICIGYSARNSHIVPEEVQYGGSRRVNTSDVAALLEGCEAARTRVYSTILLRKAMGWRYEREWRLIDSRGLQESPLELEEIIFGMRVSAPVMYTIMKALEGRVRMPKFYRISEDSGAFKLKKFPVNLDDEEFSELPRRSISAYEEFEELP